MTITNDYRDYSVRGSSVTDESSTVSGPLFTPMDILGGILAAVMLFGPLAAGATHASHQGWQTESTRNQ